MAEEKEFALKGGTAINLFHRNMPRLSVDIDLTYLPVADRAASLANIDAALHRIAASMKRGIPLSSINPVRSSEGFVTKLIVKAYGSQIKIEVTPVLRGFVYRPVQMAVSPKTEEEFGYAGIQVVSFADLYAGKIVAALDRQHPRDLFDVRDLLAAEASRMSCAGPSSCIFSVTTDPWRSCSRLRVSTSPRNSEAGFRV